MFVIDAIVIGTVDRMLATVRAPVDADGFVLVEWHCLPGHTFYVRAVHLEIHTEGDE